MPLHTGKGRMVRTAITEPAGRGGDDVVAYHVRQSFKPGEVTPEEANRIGVEFARRFTKGNHAFIVCTHIGSGLPQAVGLFRP